MSNNAYLSDLKGKGTGMGAIDVRYNPNSNAVNVSSGYNTQGINFQTGQGGQFGITYDPTAQKHFISDYDKFYGSLGLANPNASATQNNQPSGVTDFSKYYVNQQPQGGGTTPTGSTTTGAGTTPPPTNPYIDLYNKAIAEYGKTNIPPANTGQNLYDPNAVKAALTQAQQYAANPNTVPYQQATGNAQTINQMYDAQKTALISQIQGAIAKSRGEYQAQAAALPQTFDPLRNQADVRAYQNQQAIREAMAGRGMAQNAGAVGGSGQNLSLQQQARTGAENAIAGYNQQQAQQQADINRQLSGLTAQEGTDINAAVANINAQRSQALLSDQARVEQQNYERQQAALGNQINLANTLGSQYQQERQYNQAADIAQQQMQQSKQGAYLNALSNVVGFGYQGQDAEMKAAALTGEYQGKQTLDAKLADANVQRIADQTGMQKDEIRLAIRRQDQAEKVQQFEQDFKNKSYDLQVKDLDSLIKNRNVNTETLQAQLNVYNKTTDDLINGQQLDTKAKEIRNKQEQVILDNLPDKLKADLTGVETQTKELVRSGDFRAAQAKVDNDFNILKEGNEQAYRNKAIDIEQMKQNNDALNIKASVIKAGYEADKFKAAQEADAKKEGVKYKIEEFKEMNNDYKDTVKYGMEMLGKSQWSQDQQKSIPVYNQDQIAGWARTQFNGYPEEDKVKLIGNLMGALGFQPPPKEPIYPSFNPNDYNIPLVR